MSINIKKPRQNIIDRAVSFFSPSAGISRLRNRMILNSGYTGGQSNRPSTRGWTTTRGGSSDVDDLKDQKTLVARSRDEYRNTPIAGAAINRVVTNAIGNGLKLQSRINAKVLNITDEQARAWETETETRFKTWAESKLCDVTKSQNFFEMQNLALLTMLQSADCFITMPLIKRKFTDSDLRLNLYEGDFVSNPDFASDNNKIAGGIELDTLGAAYQYWFSNKHPNGESYCNLKWSAIKAYGRKSGRQNLIHLFKKERPGQRRGIPFLAPILELLHQLGRYSDSELMAALINSYFTVFIKQETIGDNVLAGNIPDNELVTGNKEGDEKLIEMGSGNAVGLAEGEDPVFADPKRPHIGFEKFFLAIVKQMGARLEIPYEQLILHFDSSYSASRASLLEGWKLFLNRRIFMATNFCQPVYESWLFYEILSGRIEAPGYQTDNLIRHAYNGANWVGSGMGQIDPVKETKAAILKLDSNLSEYETEYMKMNGGDWQSAMERKAQNEKHLKGLGLDIILDSEGSSVQDPTTEEDK